MDELLAYGERKIRAALRGIPDGVYAFEDWMDDDGVGGPPVPLRVGITVAGDQIALDFAGTGRQVPGDVNVVYLALVATVYYVLKAVLDPDIPANGGFYRAIGVDGARGHPGERPAAGARGLADADLPARGRSDSSARWRRRCPSA